jgi:putative addiction module CopG family antidote
MSTMNNNLDIAPDMQQFLRSMVDQGKFHTEAEVVEEALRVLQKRQQHIEKLRQEILPAIERLNRGEGIEVSEDELDGFFDDIMTEIDPSFQKDKVGQ